MGKKAPNLFGIEIDGKYRLGDPIGGGGFGWVYRCHDMVLNRQVAVKILQPEDETYSDEQKTRFLQEARMTASLQAPTTVSIYAYGEFDAEDVNYLYMVMEYVEGQTLFQYLQKHGPLSPLECAHILMEVLTSLDEAHARGFIHRDLKTPNIMVSRPKFGRQDKLQVKVLDYGIAKAFVQTEDWQQITQDSSILQATPQYAAPEQLLQERVGPYTDLYSLGIVAYSCLVGHSPYAHIEKPVEMLLQVVDPKSQVRLPAPHEQAPLGDIVHKMLTKNLDPERGRARYMTCREVLDDLNTLETQDRRQARLDEAAEPSAFAKTPVAELKLDSVVLSSKQPLGVEPPTELLKKPVEETEEHLLTMPAPDPALLYGFEDRRTNIWDAVEVEARQAQDQLSKEPVVASPVSLEQELALAREPELVLPEPTLEISPTPSKAVWVALALVSTLIGVLTVWIVTAPGPQLGASMTTVEPPTLKPQAALPPVHQELASPQGQDLAQTQAQARAAQVLLRGAVVATGFDAALEEPKVAKPETSKSKATKRQEPKSEPKREPKREPVEAQPKQDKPKGVESPAAVKPPVVETKPEAAKPPKEVKKVWTVE